MHTSELLKPLLSPSARDWQYDNFYIPAGQMLLAQVLQRLAAGAQQDAREALFSSSGYIREAALHKLASKPERQDLNFAAIMLSDHVDQVRSTALALLEKLWDGQLDAEEIATLRPALRSGLLMHGSRHSDDLARLCARLPLDTQTTLFAGLRDGRFLMRRLFAAGDGRAMAQAILVGRGLDPQLRIEAMKYLRQINPDSLPLLVDILRHESQLSLWRAALRLLRDTAPEELARLLPILLEGSAAKLQCILSHLRLPNGRELGLEKLARPESIRIGLTLLQIYGKAADLPLVDEHLRSSHFPTKRSAWRAHIGLNRTSAAASLSLLISEADFDPRLVKELRGIAQDFDFEQLQAWIDGASLPLLLSLRRLILLQDRWTTLALSLAYQARLTRLTTGDKHGLQIIAAAVIELSNSGFPPAPPAHLKALLQFHASLIPQAMLASHFQGNERSILSVIGTTQNTPMYTGW